MRSPQLSGAPMSSQSFLTALADSIVFAAERLTGDVESLASQKETSARLPVLAGSCYMQQAQRMKNRPLSIASVKMAEDNTFYVNLQSQAATGARTSTRQAPGQEPGIGAVQQREQPGVQAQAKGPGQEGCQNESPDKSPKLASREESEMIAAALIRLFPRCSTEPSLEAMADPSSSPQVNRRREAAVLLNRRSSQIPDPTGTSAQRISYQRLTAVPAADRERLRELVEATQRREALRISQRITARMKAVRVAHNAHGTARVFHTIKTVYASLSLHSQRLVTYFRRLKKLEKELFSNSR